MNELNTIASEHFAAFKALVFSAAFFLAAAIQFWVPHQNVRAAVFRNWRVNLPLGVINSVLFAGVCGNCVCHLAEEVASTDFGILALFSTPYLLRVVLSVVLLDFVAYAFHRLYHRVEILWRLHALHHSDTVYESSTAIRFHPAEILLSLGVRLAVVWAVGIPTLSLLIFELLYIFFNLLEHSDFNLSRVWEKRLGLFFITPALHRVHHSVERGKRDSNFGTILSVWDRMCGTYYRPNLKRVSVGLEDGDLNILEALLYPVRGQVHN